MMKLVRTAAIGAALFGLAGGSAVAGDTPKMTAPPVSNTLPGTPHFRSVEGLNTHIDTTRVQEGGKNDKGAKKSGYVNPIQRVTPTGAQTKLGAQTRRGAVANPSGSLFREGDKDKNDHLDYERSRCTTCRPE